MKINNKSFNRLFKLECSVLKFMVKFNFVSLVKLLINLA